MEESFGTDGSFGMKGSFGMDGSFGMEGIPGMNSGLVGQNLKKAVRSVYTILLKCTRFTCCSVFKMAIWIILAIVSRMF